MKKIIGKTNRFTRKLYKKYKARLQCRDPLLLRMISNYGLFDSKWYLETNSDVREAKIDPLYHYISNGWLEGRIPFASYSEKLYLQMAPDYVPGLSSPLVDMARRVAHGTLSQENLALLKSLDNSTIPHDHHRLYNGITICGFLCSEIGLGQAARNLAYSADIARVNVDFYNLSVPGRDNDTEFATKCGSWIYADKALFVLPLDANALRLLKKPREDILSFTHTGSWPVFPIHASTFYISAMSFGPPRPLSKRCFPHSVNHQLSSPNQ